MAAAAIPAVTAAMGSSWAIPAIGAAAGAMLNKDNRMQGALMGGLGGMALGPSMAGLLGGGAASGAAPAALAAGNVSVPFSSLAAGKAAMAASALPSVSAAEAAMMGGGKGLLGMMSDPKMLMKGGQMLMGGQGQQPMQAPVQQAIPQRAQYPQTEAMTALQQQRQMYQPRSTRLY